MAEFVYDEMVTAQSLNEIAVDLGAGDFSVFSDNTPYAVGKLNEITQSLVSSGISSALNRFELTVNQDSIVVGTGIAFFSSGKKFKLTLPVTLPFQPGELYIYEKQSTGVVSIVIGELPADNYIHLATINEDATFADKRVIAKAKVELPTEGNSFCFTEEYKKGVDINTVKEKTITIPIKGVSKIIIIAMGVTFGVLDINSQLFSGIYLGYSKFYTYSNSNVCYLDHRHSGTPNQTISLSIESITEESVVLKHNISTNMSQAYDNLTVDFYVFGGVER